MTDRLALLTESPFFERLDPIHLEHLARSAQLETFAAGDVIIEEGSAADHLYMLVAGEVQLSFRTPEAAGPAGQAGQVLIHTISEPGRPIGWSSMVEPHHYRASAIARAPTRVLAFERAMLERYCAAHPDFGMAFMQRILWVLGNRLRDSRIRLVARRYEKEVVAIRALLDQSAETLSVASPLHKIPHYLENRLTLADAFRVLEMVRRQGDEIERNLASLCLEILEQVRKEMRLYRSLQQVYQHVVGAADSEDPAEVRRKCSLEFVKLFAATDAIVTGEEHLPSQPGHIFIMNHLKNHLENTLPNDFQLTLDTHFVSAVVLFQKYGQAPVRVIRKSRPDEYAHQAYYDRLGYLYVYRGFVDEPEAETPVSADARRRFFLDAAGAVLASGLNLVICPEGTSTSTEESPLPFRTGAFRLAAYTRPEPLIVPIAVANFDKKITRTRVAAIIYPPFRLSEVLPDPVRDEALRAFVASYHETYRRYVQEAIDQAAS